MNQTSSGDTTHLNKQCLSLQQGCNASSEPLDVTGIKHEGDCQNYPGIKLMSSKLKKKSKNFNFLIYDNGLMSIVEGCILLWKMEAFIFYTTHTYEMSSTYQPQLII